MTVVLPNSIRVLMPNDQVTEMKLEIYVAGVVESEMGGNVPLEALKAQAVASRTYAASAHRHPELGADVCTTAHCQNWKRVDPIVAPETFRAVGETWGVVAIHDGKLIDAFFFEHCDGHTRSSEELAMPAVPYLHGVDCACGFLAKKGHGVGLCQRGAIAMARRGASFEQILRHYYRGVVILHTVTKPPPVIQPRPAPRVQASQEPASPARPRRTRQAPSRSGKKTVKPAPPSQPAPPPVVLIPPPAVPALDSPQVVPPDDREKRPAVPAEAVPVDSSPAQPEQSPVVSPLVPSKPEISREPAAPPVASPAPAPPPGPGAPAEKAEENAASVPEIRPADIAPPTSAGPEMISESTAQKPEMPAERAAPVVDSSAPAAPAESLAAAPAEDAAVPVPSYVEQLNASAFLTAEQISATPVPTVEPVVPAVDESELPALHEVVSVSARRYHVDHLPGERMIAGCLSAAGIVVTIEDGAGTKTYVFSGCAPHYGDGGFETIIAEDGRYTVTIEDEELEVEVAGNTIFIHAA